MRKLPVLLLSITALVAGTAGADWKLDRDASTISFSSVKNSTIVEPHVFTALSGRVEADGTARVKVDLASVDTLIPIRDERMRELLFETATFPQATFEATVPVDEFEAMKPGESKRYELKGTLNLHGNEVTRTLGVNVVKSGADRYAVNSIRPMVISAGDFGLTSGLNQLREIAGLTGISPMVPISFSLTFNAEE